MWVRHWSVVRIERGGWRIQREARKIAECTSYTPCVLLSFSGGSKEKRERSQSVPLTLPASYSLFLWRIRSMDWTELGRQRYSQCSTAPTPATTSAHSRQQITNVEAISGRTAVLQLTWASTSREQLASRFIVSSPAPQHNLSASAGPYSSARFLSQHPKNLPETLAPTTCNQLASCFIVSPSAS